MPPLRKLINFLKKNRAKYKIIEHKKVFTTFDAAKTQGISLKQVAKTLLVKADNSFAFVVIRGDRKLNLVKLKKFFNDWRKEQGEKKVKSLKLASEEQIKRNVTKKIGALPPFGSLFKLPTFVDKLLLRSRKLNLNAGSFTDSIEMTSAEYRRLEKPIEGIFSK